MHAPSPSRAGPKLLAPHPTKEAPCGEVVHLHLGICVSTSLGSLGSLGITLAFGSSSPAACHIAAS